MTPEQALALAIASSLARDGYIDLIRSDGEGYLEGVGLVDDDIVGTAESILAALHDVGWTIVREPS